MPRAFLARDSHLDDRRARVLRAERFVEQLNRDLSLLAQRVGKFRGASACEIRLPFLVERLTDDDQADFVFSGKVRHLRRVEQTRHMLDDFEWAGNRRSRVAERETDPLFAMAVTAVIRINFQNLFTAKGAKNAKIFISSSSFDFATFASSR